MIICSELCVDFVHVFLNNLGHCVIILVAGFSVLEEDVSVFMRAAHYGAFGIESALTERFNGVHVAHFLKIFIVPDLNLLNFMRSAETVKEVDERNSALDCRKVSNCAEIHNLLRVGFGKHCKTCLTAGVNVRMIAEDVKSVGSNATGRNVENRGKKFTGNLIHIRDHEKKTLRSGIGCGESACCERAVNGTCRAGFGLHFGNLNGGSEDVFHALCRPLVNIVCHGA